MYSNEVPAGWGAPVVPVAGQKEMMLRNRGNFRVLVWVMYEQRAYNT